MLSVRVSIGEKVVASEVQTPRQSKKKRVTKINVHGRELGSPSRDNLEIQGYAFDLSSELIEEGK